MDKPLLERVCNAPGPSGFEEPAQQVVHEVLASCCDKVWRDRLGNVIGLKKAAQPPSGEGRACRVVLAAHVDEIGMMVKHIDERGFIHFQPLGGLHPQSIISQRVVIHGRRDVGAVVAPDTRAEQKDKVAAMDDIVLDTGLSAETVREAVQIGDVATFACGLEMLNEKTYVGRNFDDRIGVYCLLDAMRRVRDTRVDVYAVGTVQEEVGVRGMPAAAFAIEPDIGIALDGSLAWDPHVPQRQRLCALGQGTGIYLMDGLTIGHRRLVAFLIDLCERMNIPFQRNIGGGTDASALQRVRSGSLATTVGAPVRYMHSTVQLCHEDDIEATVALLAAFLENAHVLREKGDTQLFGWGAEAERGTPRREE